MIALLSLGIGTVFRDTAVSTGIALGLLYLPPLLAELVSGPWRRHIQQIAPMTAGLAIQATRNIRSLPIAPWAGSGFWLRGQPECSSLASPSSKLATHESWPRTQGRCPLAAS